MYIYANTNIQYTFLDPQGAVIVMPLHLHSAQHTRSKSRQHINAIISKNIQGSQTR